MATHEKTTPLPGAEAFLIGRDADGSPIHKPVAAMTGVEQLRAMQLALDAFDAAKDELAPFEPLIQAEYLPESVDMGISILAAIFALEEAHDRLTRLADAVTAKGAH
jgi:hypothetical protein